MTNCNKNIETLQFITQEHILYSHFQLAEMVCIGGCKWIQLRVKDKSEEEWLSIAIQTKEVCDIYGAQLIINDNMYIAKEVGAAGIHLGKNDMPVKEARKYLGPDFIIGGTANTFEDIGYLTNESADYIGLGPFRFTETKKNLSPIIGIEGYKGIISRCNEEKIATPLIAIGGITTADIESIFNIGFYGIAISGAISNQENPTNETTKFIEKINITEKWNH